MGLLDFLLDDVSDPANFKFDERVWSERHVHELHTTLQIPSNAKGKVEIMKEVKQVARVLRYGGVPDNAAGIYLIREWDDERYSYVGRSSGPDTAGSNIRVRLTKHLSDKGCKHLKEGVLYEIRWAVTSSRDPKRNRLQISSYGANADKVAEALAVLFFDPLYNDPYHGNDWKGNLKHELKARGVKPIIAEAKRLGFLRGSKKSQDKFYQKLMNFMKGL